MSSFETNPYYNPENVGLTILHTLEGGSGYGFDDVIIWRRNEDGALVWAADSGCSCPVPFAGITPEPLDERTFNDFAGAVEECGSPYGDRMATERTEFLAKASRLIREAGK